MMSRTRHRYALTGAVAVLLLVPLGLAPSATAEPIPPPTAAVPVGSPSPDLTVAAPAARSPSPGRSTAAPAERYWFLVTPPDVSLTGRGTPEQRITASVSGYAPDPTVTIDVSGLAGVAAVRFTDPRCTVSGPTALCRLPSLRRFADEIELFLTPTAQAKPGDRGTITWDQLPPATIPGPGDDTHQVFRWTSSVTIVEGDDLVLSPLGELPTATPGSRISIPLAVTNVGPDPVDGLTVTVRLTHGLRPVTYANCRTQPYDPPYDNSTDTTCGIPGVLQPGATYDAPFEATVEVFAGRWQQVIEFLHPTATAATASWATTAQRLALTPRRGTAADDEMENQGTSTLAPLQVDTGLDLAAVGATVVGDPGEVVTAEVGLRNIGPSEIDPTDGLVFLVQLPPGIEVVSTRCSLREDGQYACNPDRWLVAPGEQAVASFSLRVTTGPDAEGTVRVLHRNGPARDIIVDDMPGNDVAALRVVSRADGLPVTGASVVSVALAGVVALVLGILAVLVARPPRRRRRESTPPDRPTWRAGL